MEEILEIKNITKKYQHINGETLAIKDVNFKVQKGEFISIIRTKWMWKVNFIINNCRTRKTNRRRNLHRKRKSRWSLFKNRVYVAKGLFARMANHIQ